MRENVFLLFIFFHIHSEDLTPALDCDTICFDLLVFQGVKVNRKKNIQKNM